MEERSKLRTRVRDATRAVLPKGLGVEVKSGAKNGAPRFDITVRTTDAQHHFVGGWAGEGWPNDVERLAIIALDLDVVYARKLSEGARAWLTERHLGWVDEAGRANISLPSGLIVARESPDLTVAAPVQDGWTRTMLAASEAVLAGIPPTVEAIEAATGISRGASANALARLERRGLLDRPGTKRGRGVSRRVVDIDAFIDEYAEAAGGFRAKQRVVLVHKLSADLLETLDTEIGPALTAGGFTWAVTGAAASTLLAPYLGDVTVVELYVERELFSVCDHLSDLLGGRVVEKGHRIEVRELPTSMSAKGPDIGGVHVALPARVYADLMAAGGRAAEAAHHLREVRGVGPDT